MKIKLGIGKKYYTLFFVVTMLSGHSIYANVYPWWNDFFALLMFMLTIPLFISRKNILFSAKDIFVVLCLAFLLIWSCFCVVGLVSAVRIELKFIIIYYFIKHCEENMGDLFSAIFNALFLLIVISLVFYILFDLNLFGCFKYSVYVHRRSVGTTLYYKNYYGIHFKWTDYRKLLGLNIMSSNGLWHEPGAYQIYINLSLVLLLFYLPQIRVYQVVILVIANVSAGSTMGIIVCVILLLLKYFDRMNMNRVVMGAIVVLSVMCLIGLVIGEKSRTGNWVSRTNNLRLCVSLLGNCGFLGTDVSNYPIFSGIFNYFFDWGVVGLLPIGIFLHGFFDQKLGKGVFAKMAMATWFFSTLIIEEYSYANIVYIVLAICLIGSKNCYDIGGNIIESGI